VRFHTPIEPYFNYARLVVFVSFAVRCWRGWYKLDAEALREAASTPAIWPEGRMGCGG